MGGLSMLFKPLAVMSDIIPFLGRMVRSGLTMVSFLIAAPLFRFITLGTSGVLPRYARGAPSGFNWLGP